MKQRPSTHLRNFTFLAILIMGPAFLWAGDIPGFTWGAKMSSFMSKSTSQGIELRRFTPGERPGYKNKIMRYILSVDPTVESKMVLLRHRGDTVRDYLFVKKRLYTVLDNMGNITTPAVDVLRQRLRSRFGVPSVEKNGPLIIRSYKNSKTKVLFYSKVVRDGRHKCKVYYYSTGIFRMLIMD